MRHMVPISPHPRITYTDSAGNEAHKKALGMVWDDSRQEVTGWLVAHDPSNSGRVEFVEVAAVQRLGEL